MGGLWPSFNTASTPARHGQYCWKQFDPASYLDRDPPYDDGDAAPWWHGLDRAGLEVAIVDLPRTIFAPEFRGLQVHDWGTHDPLAPGFLTSPPELAAEILERYGSDPVGVCNRAPRSEARHYRELLARLSRRTTLKRELARDLMARWGWDLFALGFGDAHCIGHQCWHLHDATHAQHDPALACEIGDPLLQVYRGLDQALADLSAAAGPEATLILLLSHGVGPHYDGDHLIDEALARIDKTLRHGRSLTLAERASYLVRAGGRERPRSPGGCGAGRRAPSADRSASRTTKPSPASASISRAASRMAGSARATSSMPIARRSRASCSCCATSPPGDRRSTASNAATTSTPRARSSRCFRTCSPSGPATRSSRRSSRPRSAGSRAATGESAPATTGRTGSSSRPAPT